MKRLRCCHGCHRLTVSGGGRAGEELHGGCPVQVMQRCMQSSTCMQGSTPSMCVCAAATRHIGRAAAQLSAQCTAMQQGMRHEPCTAGRMHVAGRMPAFSKTAAGCVPPTLLTLL